jgi:hypothetical protein
MSERERERERGEKKWEKKKKVPPRARAMRLASSAHGAASKDNRTGSKVLALLRETLRSHGN